MVIGSMVLGILVGTVMTTPQRRPGLAGRWDLTVTADGVSYPSWLEVVVEGNTLAGRFQGRTGHATPIAGVTVTGATFEFLWPNEGNRSAPPTGVRGRIDGPDAISGTITGAAGKAATFVGVRAPALDRPPPVRWSAPVDLLAGGLAGWRIREEGARNGWTFADGVLTNTPPSADLVTRDTFTDFRLHLEVAVPPKGNSGIYLRGRHEIQVQDDHGQEPHSRRMGGIYGQVTPTALPSKPAGEWQTFDITFVGRRVTVVLNGVTIIDRAEIPGITGGALDSREAEPGPIMLQGDHTGVRYRNIRIERGER